MSAAALASFPSSAAPAPGHVELSPAELAGAGLYLLHFSPAYEHAQHYLGWAAVIERRVAEHLRGVGSPLVAAAVAAGCRVELVRVWPGASRNDEAACKRSRNGRQRCPLCTSTPRGIPRCRSSR